MNAINGNTVLPRVNPDAQVSAMNAVIAGTGLYFWKGESIGDGTIKLFLRRNGPGRVHVATVRFNPREATIVEIDGDSPEVDLMLQKLCE